MYLTAAEMLLAQASEGISGSSQLFQPPELQATMSFSSDSTATSKGHWCPDSTRLYGFDGCGPDDYPIMYVWRRSFADNLSRSAWLTILWTWLKRMDYHHPPTRSLHPSPTFYFTTNIPPTFSNWLPTITGQYGIPVLFPTRRWQHRQEWVPAFRRYGWVFRSA